MNNLIFAFFLFFVIQMASADDSDVISSFESNGIVPDIIPIAPTKELQITFGINDIVHQGTILTPTLTKEVPTVTWDADQNSFYTLVMFDPDSPSRAEPVNRAWHQWIVGNIPGNNMGKGETLSEYLSPGPPEDTGLHRFVTLVYKQSGQLVFNEPHLNNTSIAKRSHFSVSKFAKKYNLSNPVAGNFFQAKFDDYVPILYASLTDL